MRNGKLFAKKSLKNAAWLIMLLVCFAVVFTTVMSLDAYGGTVFAPIASAGTDLDNPATKDESILGASDPIQGSLKASDLKSGSTAFIGAGFSTTSWSATADLSGVQASAANMEVYKPSTQGKVKLYLTEGNSSADAGKFSWGVKESKLSYTAAMAINYRLSDFMIKLLNNDGFTIKATVTAKLTTSNVAKNDGWVAGTGHKKGTVYFGLENSAAKVRVSTVNSNLGSYSKPWDKDAEASNHSISQEITLAKENPILALGFGMKWGTLTTSGEVTRRMTISDIKIAFTVTYSPKADSSSRSFNDGAAPILTRQFVGGATEVYTPNIASNTNLPVYYAGLGKDLDYSLDKVTAGKGGAQLSSYTNTSLGTIGGYNYYKKAEMQFNDAYDYSYSSTKFTTPSDYAGIGAYLRSGTSWLSRYGTTTYDKLNLNTMVSGIKTVIVSVGSSSAEFTIYNLTGTSSAKDFGSYGYATVRKDSRNQVVVTLYMRTNAEVNVAVADYGGMEINVTTTFSGIDTTAPSSVSTSSNFNIDSAQHPFLKTSTSQFNAAPWYKETQVSMEVDVTGSVNDSPYGEANKSPVLWFYAVKKADYSSGISGLTTSTAASVLGSASDKKYKNLIPIGFGKESKFNFDFDFTTGKARGYGLTGYSAGNPSGLSEVSGSGYYQFTFYAMDAAGNISSSTKSYYMKVDCERPQYNVEFSFDKSGNIINIPFAENGKIWATGEATLKLVFDKVNISGNTILFNDNANPSNRFMIVLNRDNNNNDGKPFGWYDGATVDLSSNSRTFTVVSRTGNTQVTITYNELSVGNNQGAELVFTFQGKVDDAFPTVAWLTEFTAYTGIYASPDAIATDEDNQKTVWKNVNEDWGEVNILIDRNNPTTPVVLHDYLHETVNDDGNLSLVDGVNGYSWSKIIRNWYTEEYSITASTVFNDSVLNIDAYKNGLKIYYGIKYVRTESDLAALWENGQDVIESKYRSFAYGDDAWKSNFGLADGVDADARLDLVIDLIAVRNAGMRVVYIWAVDQAGNCSDISIQYILADAQNYNITSEVRANAQLESKTASIAQRKDAESGATSFKRGETVTFDLTLSTGYVPYMFTKTGNNGEPFTLLENYNPTLGWRLNDGAADYDGIIAFEPYNSLTYTVDSNVDLGSLDSRTKFTFSHRKVVHYDVINIANNKVTLHYNSKAAVIPLSYSDLESKGRFVFRYVDSDGNVLYKDTDGQPTADITLAEGYNENPELSNPVYFQAITLGTYRVRIYIPQHDDSYVTDNYTSASNVQTFENCTIDVEIRQGEVTVIAKATQSMYGVKIELDYESVGFNPADGALMGEELVGTLTLKGITGWKNNILDIGEYDVTYDTPFSISENYKVTFEGSKHTVTKRPVSISTWAKSKNYGDPEPTSYVFGVDSTQFKWFTDWGTTYTVDKIVKDIFGAYSMHEELGSLNGKAYYLFDIGRGSGISRELSDATENVPAGDGYDYIVDTKLFNISDNFSLSAQNTQKFNILRRKVTLDVSGGETLLPAGASYDPSAIIPVYRLTGDDGALNDKIQNEISACLAGKLSLSSDTVAPTLPMPDKYSSWVWHEVRLDASANTRNLEFELGDDVVYIIGFASGSAIFVRMKSNETISFVFGTQWTDGLLNFADFADKFELSSEDGVPEYGVEFDNIDWALTLRNVDFGAYIPVGSHQISVSEAQLSKDGAALSGYSVLVESFNITVTAAPIVVRPTSQTQYKVYGEAESIYGIGFEIVSVGGKPIAGDGSFAGISYQTILSQIKGEFARGQYAKSGNFSVIAGQYSDATDENGVIFGTDGWYYGYAERSAFGCDNSNFTIVTDIDGDVRFYVQQKSIDLDAAKFVGVSRSYTGFVNVSYGKTVPYDISADLARAQDDVRLSIVANYTEEGSIEQPTDVGIIITNIRLDGNQKNNYKLGFINNTSSTAELFEGSNKVNRAEISDSVSVIIYYINNNTDISNTVHIQIYTGSVAVRKSDFTITKQYDNTVKLEMSAVSIRDYTDDNGYGTTTLYNIWRDGNVSIVEGVSYPKSSLSDSHMIGEIVLFFPIKGASGLEIINNVAGSDYNDPTVIVEAALVNGVEGIKITLKNVSASITKRVLGVNAFESITPVNRAYNANAIVNTQFVFADSALAAGEDASTVGLTLMAYIEGNNYGTGDHAIAFAAVGDDKTNTKLKSNNYFIDIEALNRYYFADNAKTVNISRAKLLPNITFGETDEQGVFHDYKTYDGTYDVPYKINEGNPLTTLEYSKELAAELAQFSIVGTPEYKLSSNGNLDMNVAFDAEGNVILHNVMVIGLQIAEGSSTSYLSNYEIYGERYSGGEYVWVGSVAKDVIDDFEMRGAFMVRKNSIKLLPNNVFVKEKVYDGTRDADISVDLQGTGIVEGHEKHIKVTAEGMFAKSIVSDNVTVQIGNATLIATTDGGQTYIKNYVLEEYSERRIAGIMPRPVGVTASLGVKTYDGSARIPGSVPDITTDGIFDGEKGAYAVLASGGAYYLDKNVEYDMSGETPVVTDKQGVIYNPALHSNRGMVNYQLTNAVNTYAGEGYIAYSIEGKMYYHEVYGGDKTGANVTYYYPLPTANKYIDIDSPLAAADGAAMTSGLVVGRYVLNEKEVYAVDSAYNGSVSGTMPSLTYVRGKGRVERKKVYISSAGIKMIDGSQAFEKMFDGTSKFFGEEDVDFYYEEGSISGVVEADRGKVEIQQILGEFDKANTTANYVVFTAQGITGEEADNYIIDDTSMTAKIRGKIKKRTIISNLKDGTIVYGENTNLVEGDITYRVLGNRVLVDSTSRVYEEKQYDLDLWNGGLFMSFANYAEMMGYKDDDYKSNPNLNVFVKDGDGYIRSEITDIANIEYFIMLSSITELPTAKAKFTVSKPSANTSAKFVLAGGTAVNYTFLPEYKDGAENATITVVAKDLFVATDGAVYTQVYASAEQMQKELQKQIVLRYLDSEGNDGIATSESPVTVFGRNYLPVAKIGVYDKETKVVKPIEQYPAISADLNENEVYVIYFTTPDGVDDYSEVIANYNIHLGGVIEIVDGALTTTYEGFKLGTNASEINVVLPSVADVALGTPSSDNTFNVTYDGSNLTGSALIGAVKAGDDIYMLDLQNNTVRAINAGVYTGYVVVERPIESGTHGYKAVWKSSSPVTVDVAKASPQLNVRNSSKYYDGEKFEYTVSGGDSMITYLVRDGLNIRKEDANVEYFRQISSGKYEKVDEMRDAATYQVRVSLNDSFKVNNPNYNEKEIATGTFTIVRAIVNVKIDCGDYKVATASNGSLILGAVYDSAKTYNINYTLSMSADTPSSILIKAQDTKLVFANEIKSSGRYLFSVAITASGINASNYNVVGGGGMLELTTTNVSSSNATLELSKDIVANRVVAHEVYDETATANDMELWSKVDKYMPHIDQNASISAIVRLSLYYGNSIVSLNGTTATVDVRLPENIKSLDGIAIYTVTSSGGLERLSDYELTQDGRLKYETDFLGALVFVDLNANALPTWAVILIAVGCCAVVLTLAVTFIGLAIKKSKLKKMM